MIWIIISVIVLILIFVALFFMLRKPGAPKIPAFLDPLIPPTSCSPTLAEVDPYAIKYVRDDDGKTCVPDGCKPGYDLYYSDPNSINKFRRCQ